MDERMDGRKEGINEWKKRRMEERKKVLMN